MPPPVRHPTAVLRLGIALLLVTSGGASANADPAAMDPERRVLGGVQSMSELRWDGIVRQRIEVNCAAASLATILTYYFGFAASEQELADAMMAEAEAVGQGELVRRIGFSMAHIKRVAEKGGLFAEGFQVPIEHLDRIRIPVIARVSIRGFDHFVVFKGAQNGRIFVADPAFGNGSYRLAAFEKIWSGLMIGFVRQGQNPQDHLLTVEARDELGEAWERISDRHLRAARVPGRSVVWVSSQSLPPFLTETLTGFESVFPRFLATRTRF